MPSKKFISPEATMADGSSYEQDPRPLAVDTYTNTHLISPSNTPYHAALEHAYTNSLAQGLDDIAVAPSQGRFLQIQTKLMRAKHVLEIGTLGGYSSIWFASAGKDVQVTSLEVDAHHKEVAEENIKFANLQDRITVLLGEALTVLPTLVSAVQAGTRPPFDLVFIDADKANNAEYFRLVMEMVRSGSCIYVDNVVRKGKLVDEKLIKHKDSAVMGSRAVVEAVGKDKRVEGVVLQTVSEKNYDGFLMCVVK
jgi:predicted O-methyltransferase YrrM